jgi:hypothetical protein
MAALLLRGFYEQDLCMSWPLLFFGHLGPLVLLPNRLPRNSKNLQELV